MQPTKQQETGMAVIGVAVMLLIVLLTMCSCATKKVVEERVYVHDTVTVHKSDTVVDVRVVQQHDTIANTEVHTFTVNNVGDTIKEVHHFHNTEKTVVVDSTYRYKAKLDSLQAIIDSRQEQVVEVKKSPFPSIRDMIVAALIIIVVTVALLRRK